MQFADNNHKLDGLIADSFGCAELCENVALALASVPWIRLPGRWFQDGKRHCRATCAQVARFSRATEAICLLHVQPTTPRAAVAAAKGPGALTGLRPRQHRDLSPLQPGMQLWHHLQLRLRPLLHWMQVS